MLSLPADQPVFVVDDSAPDRMIIRTVLRSSRLQNPVETFASGSALLARMAAVRAGTAPPPAVILLDLNMPGMSGLEVLARLCAEPERPLVVILTSSDAEEERDRALALGADAYLAKQSGLAAFIEMIDAAFGNVG